MVRKKRGKPREQDNDYDGAWKEAGHFHFREIMEKYFAAIAGKIDWSVLPESHNKELSRVLARTGHRAGRVDMLVKVRLLSGQTQWTFLHLEVQSSREADFALRIGRYHGGLSWIFEERVISLVILADLDENWRPSEDLFRLGDFESRLRFPVCKLVDRVDHEWGEDDRSLAVQIARAQIAALRTAGDPEGRYTVKWQLVRNLYKLGYNAEELREVFRLIDWMMQLPEELGEKFKRELSEFEENLTMPHVTSVERIAEARGRAEGEARGQAEGEARGEARGRAEAILTILGGLCGPLPEEVQQRVRRLSVTGLDRLAKKVPQFHSLPEVQAWLDADEKRAR